VTGADPSAPFRWHDGERLIVFGRGKLEEMPAVLEPPYAVLTTERAKHCAPAVVERATAVHEVKMGRVDELAEALRASVRAELLVAIGGGRVIDVAKALAAADPPRRVAAVPTTLSGAEMTAVHRHAAGVPGDTVRVRPAIVINDPAISASLPAAQLAQSAANALGHAVEGPLTARRNPVATLAALDAARLIADGFDLQGRSDALRATESSPDDSHRAALALGALLAGYAIGSSGYGLHHVVSQTLARLAGVGHGAANAIMLPQSLGALARRFSDEVARLGDALRGDPVELATRLRDLTGLRSLRQANVTAVQIDQCAEEAAARPELDLTPPPADREELHALYEAAW
jgi:alcohol dehydrogenase class IV